MTSRALSLTARGLVVISLLSSLAFSALLIYSACQIISSMREYAEMSPQTFHELQSKGFLPKDAKIDDTRDITIAEGSVIHLSLSSCLVEVPFILLLSAYLVRRDIQFLNLTRISALSMTLLYLLLMAAVIACRIHSIDIIT